MNDSQKLHVFLSISLHSLNPLPTLSPFLYLSKAQTLGGENSELVNCSMQTLVGSSKLVVKSLLPLIKLITLILLS